MRRIGRNEKNKRMRRIRENEKNKRMMKKNRDWKKVQQK